MSAVSCLLLLLLLLLQAYCLSTVHGMLQAPTSRAVAAAAEFGGCMSPSPLHTSIDQHCPCALIRPACQQLSTGLAAHGRHIEVPELHGLLHKAVKVGCADPLGFPARLLRLMPTDVIKALVICQHNYEVGSLASRQCWNANPLGLCLGQRCGQKPWLQNMAATQ